MMRRCIEQPSSLTAQGQIQHPYRHSHANGAPGRHFPVDPRQLEQGACSRSRSLLVEWRPRLHAQQHRYTSPARCTEHQRTSHNFYTASQGVAWVNGFNLGWYWPDKGPQMTLFIPGPLLQAGDNELSLLEMHRIPDEPTGAGFVMPVNVEMVSMRPTMTRLTQRVVFPWTVATYMLQRRLTAVTGLRS